MTRSSLPLLLSALAVACGDAEPAPACGETLASSDGRYSVPVRGDVVHLRVPCVGELGTTVDVVRHASDPGPWRVSCPGATIAAPGLASCTIASSRAPRTPSTA
jgi:hypothetical protein